MNRALRSTEINMLEGPLLGKVFAFALPLMLSNLLQVCYSAADMVVVGLSNVDGALGAIGTCGAFINLILNVFFGITIGAGIVVARNIGKGDKLATEKAVHTSLIIGLAAGLLCSALGVAVSRPVLALLGDEGHVLDLASLYTRIYFLGAPFLSLNNFLIAILRAKGDTRTPLYILTLSGLANVGLNLFFVLVLHMSVDGVATATVIANALSTVLLTYVLSNDTSWCRLRFDRLRFDRGTALEVIREGIPAGIQGALFSVSNMLIQSSIIGINNAVCPGGSDIIDGNAAAQSLGDFVYTAMNSVSQAAVTFTSQHFGAKKYKRIGVVMRDCYFASFLISAAVSSIIFVFKDTFVGFYVSSDLAIRTAVTRLSIMIVPYFLCGTMEIGSSVLRGFGKSLLSTTISLIGSCLLRVVWIYTIFQVWHTLEAVYLSYPVSWILTACIHFVFCIAIRRRYMKEQAPEIAVPAA